MMIATCGMRSVACRWRRPGRAASHRNPRRAQRLVPVARRASKTTTRRQSPPKKRTVSLSRASTCRSRRAARTFLLVSAARPFPALGRISKVYHVTICSGQRQLLALARGILKLKSSSILILDESTASLDSATDERIQQTIRDEMTDATILCIARTYRSSSPTRSL